MRVALLGTGHMGIELGKHILAAGMGLTVWNRTAARAEPLVAAGAALAPSAAAAAQGADLVITALFGPVTVTVGVTMTCAGAGSTCRRPNGMHMPPSTWEITASFRKETILARIVSFMKIMK